MILGEFWIARITLENRISVALIFVSGEVFQASGAEGFGLLIVRSGFEGTVKPLFALADSVY